MKSQPRVSVGLPVYNGEAYLAQTIESILAQDYANLELVISDNASTDATQDICQRYQALDARVRYRRSDVNRGAVWNFNRVFELSSGEFFKWQAYDDLCLPTFLSSCLREFERSPMSVVLVYPRPQAIDEHGKPLGGLVERSVATSDPQAHRRLSVVLRKLSMVSSFYGLIRASELRKTRLLGRFIAGDWVMLAELSMLGEIREVPETLFLRRVHPKISTYAHPRPQDLLLWLDTSRASNGVLVGPDVWVGVELLRSVYHIGLSRTDKLRCYTTALTVWYWRIFRVFAGKHRQRLVAALKSALSEAN
jgi:hypothetical protein